jgi:hypothetical protein
MGADLDFKLPSALPALPGRPQAPAAIEVEAVRRRVDLQIAASSSMRWRGHTT